FRGLLSCVRDAAGMQRLVCLDGLRGVLAVYVMLSHTLPFAPMPAWLGWLFSHGGAAVDVFFVLSGLVIVQSLDSFGYRARPFLIARVARIYPVFLVVFAFAVAVQPLATGFSHMVWIGADSQARFIWSEGWPHDWAPFIATHLTMTHGLFPDGVLPDVWVGFLGAAWSLSTEWQFYLLALAVGARLELPTMAWLFLVISLGGVAWHAGAPEPWQFSRAFLPNKAQYFALGIASAMLVRQGMAGLGSYIAVLGATLAVCAMQGGLEKLLPPAVWTLCLAAQLEPGIMASPRTNNLPLSLPEGGGGLWALATALQSRPLVWLGAASYSIYLVNEPVQKLLGVTLAHVTQGDVALFTALWLPGAVLLPLLAAWALHVVIEAPALRYGRTLARRGMAAAPVSAG
ncbi:MAG TPA: acyltransferase, partial [Acetobacteraceae bacterium]|nr:acyltransferase [Acetobacteraceae bacterium]